MTKVEVFAPAKVNLTLHVTGRRADGYHLIDSLVAFAGVGDRLTLSKGGTGRLTVTGPEAAALPAGGSNLIATQAHFLATGDDLDCILHKELPVASGIGGGSADAGAYFRGAAALAAPDAAAEMMAPDMISSQWAIGADVPMCIASSPARVTGIGDLVNFVEGLPEWPIVLVNPRLPVPTGDVFRALASRDNAPMGPVPSSGLLEWLSLQRNDLQTPAIRIAPVIGSVLAELADQAGCALARMSGSGATCFGLFETTSDATQAAGTVSGRNPDWWVRATRLDGHRLAAAQEIRSTT